jgi:predicted small integral membrane protein
MKKLKGYKNLNNLHNWLKHFFEIGLVVTLQILVWFLGFICIMGPVLYIWTSIIDKDFNVLLSFVSILIGICLFYLTLALKKMIGDDE